MNLGTIAPDFNLLDTVSGEIRSLASLKGKMATVIMFICNHCPYVQHIEKEVVRVAKEYQTKEVGFIAISANDVESYPQDAPELMKQRAIDVGYPFPYLYDATQSVAKAYDAQCTPEFFVFDQALACVYHGRFDDATPRKSAPVTGKDLCIALDAVLAGKEVEGAQHPSIGCNIKWKSAH
jgi:peroxiredoxin